MDGIPPSPQPGISSGISSGDEATAPLSGEPPTANQAATGVPTPTAAQAAAMGRLEEEIGHFTRQGYFIVDRGPTSVQLKRTKHFSVWWALLWFIVVPGGGLFIYLGWYLLVKRDRIAFLRITPEGRVMLSEN